MQTQQYLVKLISGDSVLAVCPKEQGEYKTLKAKTYSGRGVRPLLQAIIDDKDFFASSYVADKVVGRAVALLFAYAGVERVFAFNVSAPALEVLKQNNIECNYSTVCEFIANRDNTGQCPMEKLCMDITSPEKAFAELRKKLEI